MNLITIRKTSLNEQVDKAEQILKKDPTNEQLPVLIDGLNNSYELLSIDFHSVAKEERKNHREDLRHLRERIRFVQNEFKLSRPQVIGARNINTPLTEEALIDHARSVTDSSVQSLNRTVQIIEDTKTIGAATAVKINEQTGQIVRIQDTLFSIDDQIQNARNSIGRLLRSAASNKCLWICIGLIFGLLIFILIWKKKHK